MQLHLIGDGFLPIRCFSRIVEAYCHAEFFSVAVIVVVLLACAIGDIATIINDVNMTDVLSFTSSPVKLIIDEIYSYQDGVYASFIFRKNHSWRSLHESIRHFLAKDFLP